MFNQGIGNLQRERGLMPTDSQIIRELGGGRTSQTRQRERVPSVILKAQKEERMGASENDQIIFLELLNFYGRPDLAKMLWNRYFPQNIDENS